MTVADMSLFLRSDAYSEAEDISMYSCKSESFAKLEETFSKAMSSFSPMSHGLSECGIPTKP